MNEIKELASILVKNYIEVNKNKNLNNLFEVPVGVSGRHLHLTKEDAEILFGEGYELTSIKELTQPNQFACKEQVTIAGPKGVIEKVRIIGPFRKKTQVEILASDSYKLGVKPVVRLSGQLEDTPGITIIGPKGSVILNEGVIVSHRHLHLNEEQGKSLNLKNGDIISVKTNGIRGGILDNVIVRVGNDGFMDCHIDQEEANAFGLKTGAYVQIIK